MRTGRSTTCMILLALGALILGACGGDDGPDVEKYEAGLRTMQGQLDDANTASRASADSADASERQAALAQAHAALAKAADTAASLDPPENAKRAHDKLVSALSDYADLFDKLATLDENDPSESELYTEAGEIVARIESANRALDKAGYTTKADEDS